MATAVVVAAAAPPPADRRKRARTRGQRGASIGTRPPELPRRRPVCRRPMTRCTRRGCTRSPHRGARRAERDRPSVRAVRVRRAGAAAAPRSRLRWPPPPTTRWSPYWRTCRPNCSRRILAVPRQGSIWSTPPTPRRLAAIPDGAAKTNGIAVGQAAAAAIVAVRAGDHANDAPLVDTSPRGGPPGEYEFTPGTPFAFAPKWGSVTPFTLRDSTQFASGPPYPLTSNGTRGLRRGQAAGWRRRGDRRQRPNREQTEIAGFWVESSPLAWNRMARASSPRRLDKWESGAACSVY